MNMQRLLAVAGAILIAVTADAQSLVGSYSNLRLDDSNVRGVGVGVEWPLAGPLEIGAEVTSQFGALQGEDLNEFAVLAGPKLLLRRGHRLMPFVHGKGGFARSRRQVEIFGVQIGAAGVCAPGCSFDTGLAAEAGGGFDLRLDERWTLRLAQLDYRVTRLSSDESHRVRIAAGALFSWRR